MKLTHHFFFAKEDIHNLKYRLYIIHTTFKPVITLLKVEQRVTNRTNEDNKKH